MYIIVCRSEPCGKATGRLLMRAGSGKVVNQQAGPPLAPGIGNCPTICSACRVVCASYSCRCVLYPTAIYSYFVEQAAPRPTTGTPSHSDSFYIALQQRPSLCERGQTRTRKSSLQAADSSSGERWFASWSKRWTRFGMWLQTS